METRIPLHGDLRHTIEMLESAMPEYSIILEETLVPLSGAMGSSKRVHSLIITRRDDTSREDLEAYINNGFSHPRFFVEQLKPILTPGQIIAVLKAIGNTCPYCLDGPRDCACMRDE